jgi:hypothetical protein
MVIMATIMGLEMLVLPLELISPTTCWEGPAKGEISGNPRPVVPLYPVRVEHPGSMDTIYEVWEQLVILARRSGEGSGEPLSPMCRSTLLETLTNETTSVPPN